MRYGLTPDKYQEMLRRQQNGCAICRGDPGNRDWTVDHDHETGAIRGILCSRCNTVLGMARDNSLILLSASIYLEARS